MKKYRKADACRAKIKELERAKIKEGECPEPQIGDVWIGLPCIGQGRIILIDGVKVVLRSPPYEYEDFELYFTTIHELNLRCNLVDRPPLEKFQAVRPKGSLLSYRCESGPYEHNWYKISGEYLYKYPRSWLVPIELPPSMKSGLTSSQ